MQLLHMKPQLNTMLADDALAFLFTATDINFDLLRPQSRSN